MSSAPSSVRHVSCRGDGGPSVAGSASAAVRSTTSTSRPRKMLPSQPLVPPTRPPSPSSARSTTSTTLPLQMLPPPPPPAVAGVDRGRLRAPQPPPPSLTPGRFLPLLSFVSSLARGIVLPNNARRRRKRMGGGEDIAGSVAQWTLASLAPDVSMYVSMLYPLSIIHQNQGQAPTQSTAQFYYAY